MQILALSDSEEEASGPGTPSASPPLPNQTGLLVFFFKKKEVLFLYSLIYFVFVCLGMAANRGRGSPALRAVTFTSHFYNNNITKLEMILILFVARKRKRKRRRKRKRKRRTSTIYAKRTWCC